MKKVMDQDEIKTIGVILSGKLQILFLSFNKVMHSCSTVCAFHHNLIENMLTLIADKNVQWFDENGTPCKMTISFRKKSFQILKRLD